MSEPYMDQLRKVQESFQTKPLRRLNTGGGKAPAAVGALLGASGTTSLTHIEQVITRDLKNPTVLNASAIPTRMTVFAETDSLAVARWVAIHINAWLRAWPGRQHALVNRVERFAAAGDVYARLTITVGHDGKYTPFLVLVQRTGTTSLSVNIGLAFGPYLVRPVYTAVGSRETESWGVGYATLPTGREKDDPRGL